MHKALEALCVSLESLSSTVESAAGNNDQTLLEWHGWHHPAVNRKDLARIPKDIAARIREHSPEISDPAILATVADFPRRIDLMKGNIIPHMYNGHGQQAIPAYLGSMVFISELLAPYIALDKLKDPKAMPAAQARRLRSIQIEIDQLSGDKEQLSQHISLIKEATAAATDLPTDMHALKEAREKVEKYSNDSAAAYGRIEKSEKDVVKIIGQISGKQIEADKLVQQCEDAYRITTTKGLAAAFDQRASRLGASMWVWVAGLMAALIIGSIIGASRIDALSAAMQAEDPDSILISIQFLLSLLGLGAPIWFAWLATKQIGQRFRLAEDYAFKASVAKAYEGYRKEAARIDEDLEARLFAAALSRLEEAPLRLVEHHAHGSPWAEALSHGPISDAIKSVPGFAEWMAEMARKAVSANKVPPVDAGEKK